MKFNNDLIVFIHIPRTAGTYIESRLGRKYNVYNNWPKENIVNLFGLKKINDNNYLMLQHLTLMEMIKYNFINKKENQYIFTIVRNPYDRILSTYKHYKNEYKTFDLFLDKIESINLHDYAHSGIITDNMNYNYLTMSNLEENKYMILPQYHYIQHNGDYSVDIIKYEDFEKIRCKIDIKIKFKINKNNYELTDQQKNRIYKIYQIDFDRFGFIK